VSGGSRLCLDVCFYFPFVPAGPGEIHGFELVEMAVCGFGIGRGGCYFAGARFAGSNQMNSPPTESLTNLLALSKPLAFFDIEATGTDPLSDRIVEIFILKVNPDASRTTYVQRINPATRIPSEVIAIHGITNEDVKLCPFFSEVAPKISEFLGDSDFGGYNLVEYDVKILTKEFERAGVEFTAAGRKIVDAFKIFQKNERRDLSAAYRFYCDRELKGAHGAQADVMATYEVFMAQLQKYSHLPRDIGGLHDYCNAPDERFVDSDRKFYWRDGRAYFSFGKYKSKALEQVVKDDPDYIEWIVRKGEFTQEVIDICWKALRGTFPVRGPR
jgi:DNA polymerase-3 subunit epsilon